MNDPMDRDKYPNRPDTPDFWALSKIVLDHDAQATEDHRPIPDIVGDVIDAPSFLYMLDQRVGHYLQLNGIAQTPQNMSFCGALYMDAFLLGVKFQQQKG